MRHVLALLLFATGLHANAQDRDGNDTPGEWVVTHHRPFGFWDSMCDERRTGDTLEERCYLRYVDVVAPNPNFAAILAFITPGPRIEIGIERGTAFKPGGLRIEAAQGTIWTMPHRPCLFGGTCAFDGPEGLALLDHLTTADQLVFDFIDRHGTPHLRLWDLTHFADAVRDFHDQSAARGL